MIIEALTAPIVAIGLHMGSIHVPDTMNNFNPGIYVRNAAGLSAGTLKNSESRQSVWVGQTFEVLPYVDVTVGVITGYRAMKVQPLILPTVHFPITGSIHGRIGYIPKFRANGAHAIHFMIEHRF